MTDQDPSDLINQGYRLFNQGNYQAADLAGAERAFRLFLEGCPTHPDGHSKLALVLYDQGKVAEAVRSWREALIHRDEFPDALTGLALGLWTLGERDEALTIFGQAVGLRPQVPDPDYLDEKFGWSRQAVEAIRPLIAVSAASQSVRAANNADSTGYEAVEVCDL